MHSPEIGSWRLIVPVKGQLAAKSRLHPPDGVARVDLAHAFALDTITAVLACMPPTALVVVTSDERVAGFVGDRGGAVVPDSGHGLNPAICQGITYVEAALGPGPAAVLLADIPTLRPEDLISALSACAMHSQAMVPDTAGNGTVLLSALSTTDLHPRFGPGSADRHAHQCSRLDLDLPGLRTDVDDDKALRRAVEIGIGSHTAAVLRLAWG